MAITTCDRDKQAPLQSYIKDYLYYHALVILLLCKVAMLVSAYDEEKKELLGTVM